MHFCTLQFAVNPPLLDQMLPVRLPQNYPFQHAYNVSRVWDSHVPERFTYVHFSKKHVNEVG